VIITSNSHCNLTCFLLYLNIINSTTRSVEARDRGFIPTPLFHDMKHIKVKLNGVDACSLPCDVWQNIIFSLHLTYDFGM